MLAVLAYDSSDTVRCLLQAEVIASEPGAVYSNRLQDSPASTAAANAAQPALQQRQPGTTIAERAHRALLTVDGLKAQEGPLGGFKYLSSGALAPGQKLDPVECSSGPASRAF
jgi:hypothetical protein